MHRVIILPTLWCARKTRALILRGGNRSLEEIAQVVLHDFYTSDRGSHGRYLKGS